jgi:hypothetical protein
METFFFAPFAIYHRDGLAQVAPLWKEKVLA